MNSQESNEVHPAQAAIGEQFLTIEQVCRILACSRGSVYRMINDGDLRVFPHAYARRAATNGDPKSFGDLTLSRLRLPTATRYRLPKLPNGVSEMTAPPCGLPLLAVNAL